MDRPMAVEHLRNVSSSKLHGSSCLRLQLLRFFEEEADSKSSVVNAIIQFFRE